MTMQQKINMTISTQKLSRNTENFSDFLFFYLFTFLKFLFILPPRGLLFPLAVNFQGTLAL